jgi:hypothetical protein
VDRLLGVFSKANNGYGFFFSPRVDVRRLSFDVALFVFYQNRRIKYPYPFDFHTSVLAEAERLSVFPGFDKEFNAALYFVEFHYT